MEKIDIELLKQKHKDIFGEEPEMIVNSPGRINLLGGYTAHTEGFILPMALDIGISVAISKIPDTKIISVHSLDFDKKMACMYSDLMRCSVKWFNYPVGIVKVMQKRGHKFDGVRITFTGNIPQGAGLSSSAALEMAVAYAIQEIYKLKISGLELAKICQEAEHDVVGTKGGVLDQYISRMGEHDKILVIDCKTLSCKAIPLSLKKMNLIITNSNIPKKVYLPKVVERILECQEAEKFLSEGTDGKKLRDISLEDYEKNRDLIPSDIRKRAFHIISENKRVLEAEKLIKNKDLEKFGRLLNDSNESLDINFEIMSKEMRWLTSTAQKIPGCLGSRMTGDGFRGCSISIMDDDAFKKYSSSLNDYEKEFGYKAITYRVLPSQGVQVIWKK